MAVKLPEWSNGPKRRYILSADDIPELERGAGTLEFVNRKPRGEAEDAAYNDYKRKHHVQGAAYHLGMMRAAAASGSNEAAKKHKLVYDLHRQSLGFGADDHQIPDEIQSAMSDPSRLPAPKFKAHKADAFLLGKSEPLPLPENEWAVWERNAPEYDLFGSKLGKSETPVFQLVKASDHPLEVNFLTNKLRGLRDWFDQQGIKSINEKDLTPEMRSQLMRVGRDYGGNFTRERIQQFIDSQPAAQYNWSTGKFDHAAGATQRHSNELSNVLRLDLTPQHKQQLEQAGVMGAFRQMNEMSTQSGHPVGPDTIGWVRHTGDKSGVMVDEVQTDYGRPWPAMLSEAVDKAIGRDEGRPEHRERYLADFMQQFPEDQRKVIAKVLFGNKHPAEVLQEGFDSWARGPGDLAGAPVHIWTPEAKGYQTIADPDPRGRMSTKRPLPRHFHEGYRVVPEKRGMIPGQYGEIPTQSNPKFQKKPRMTGGKDAEWRPSTETYKGTIKKAEDMTKQEILEELRKNLIGVLKKAEELAKALPGAPTPGMSGGAPAPAGKIAAPTAPSTAGVKPMAPGALAAITQANAAQAPKIETTDTSGMPKPAKLDIKMAEKSPNEDSGSCKECKGRGEHVLEFGDTDHSVTCSACKESGRASKSRIPGKK
jgi:hypothetical protein